MSVDRKKKSQDSFSLLDAAKRKPLTGPTHQKCVGFFCDFTLCVACTGVERVQRGKMESKGIWRKLIISPSPIGGEKLMRNQDRSVCFVCAALFFVISRISEGKRFI